MLMAVHLNHHTPVDVDRFSLEEEREKNEGNSKLGCNYGEEGIIINRCVLTQLTYVHTYQHGHYMCFGDVYTHQSMSCENGARYALHHLECMLSVRLDTGPCRNNL